jgi:hypothetical protein
VANNSLILKISNLSAFALTVVINSIAGGTSLLGGRDTAQISNANPTLITPAGYTFSIWGIIYLLLGIFVVYQALPSQKGSDFQRKVSWLFVLSSIFNIAWIFCWQYQYFEASIVVIALLLVSLIAIYLRLNIGRSSAKLHERIAVQLPFSVYLGWITIATIADVSVTLVSLKWGGFGIAAGTWAFLIVVIALLLSLTVIATRKDIGYSLVIIWAFIGITVNQMGNQPLVMTLELSVVIVAVAVSTANLLSRFGRKPKMPTVVEYKDHASLIDTPLPKG